MRSLTTHACGLFAALFILGSVAEVHAAFPGKILLQRRGMSRIPAKPSPIDSSPTINTLNKALTALGSTDHPYDGHREKAISHIAAAIQHMELPTGRGKSNGVVNKALSGKAPAVTKASTTPDAASDESLRKAKTILFTVHHQLTDHAATKGHIRADADIRLAIDEIVAALKVTKSQGGASAALPSAANTPDPYAALPGSTTPAAAPTTTAAKPAK